VSAFSLRPGVRAAYLVQRHLNLAPAGVIPDDSWFVDLIGFNRLQVSGCQLTLSYDASRLHLDLLLERLRLHQVIPAVTPINRFRIGWYRYLDRNVADNANDKSSTACSQSPLRHR